MPAQLRCLDYDKVTPFTAHSFGNVLAGTNGVPKLLYLDSYGDAACPQVAFGLAAMPQNDGINFAQVCQPDSIDVAGLTPSATVAETGGSIAISTTLSYVVTVLDRWGNETIVSAETSPVTTINGTSKVDLSWAAVDGAFLYRVYSKINGGSFFKTAETASTSYADVDGTNDGVTAPGGTGALKMATWVTTPLSLGDVPAGEKRPVGVRVVVPENAVSEGNPRQFKTFMSFYSV